METVPALFLEPGDKILIPAEVVEVDVDNFGNGTVHVVHRLLDNHQVTWNAPFLRLPADDTAGATLFRQPDNAF